MQFSDEDLIAYLLGDSSQELTLQIRRQLTVEPALLQRLNQFRLLLGQIDSLQTQFSPPADLLDTTLARIEQSELEPTLTDGDSISQPVVSLAQPPVHFRSQSIATPRRTSFWDSSALTVCLTLLCCLALPALVRVRFESRKAQCAQNLRINGSELINFALNDPQQRFPQVAVDGPEAFAGVYALYLHEMGGRVSVPQLHCASLLGFQNPNSPREVIELSQTTIPTFAQLHRFAMHELALWQRAIGGDYAYNLGVSEDGRLCAPKCQGRTHFAILADSPIIAGAPIIASANEQFVAHDGRGINIFYEDGRVVFVSTQSIFQAPTGNSNPPHMISIAAASPTIADHPFRNQLGVHEIGLHPHDASLAPSHFPPLRQ